MVQNDEVNVFKEFTRRAQPPTEFYEKLILHAVSLDMANAIADAPNFELMEFDVRCILFGDALLRDTILIPWLIQRFPRLFSLYEDCLFDVCTGWFYGIIPLMIQHSDLRHAFSLFPQNKLITHIIEEGLLISRHEIGAFIDRGWQIKPFLIPEQVKHIPHPDMRSALTRACALDQLDLSTIEHTAFSIKPLVEIVRHYLLPWYQHPLKRKRDDLPAPIPPHNST